MDGNWLIGIGTVIAGAVSFLTWLLTRRNQLADQSSALVDDALKLQKAAHDAYAEAMEELIAMRVEIQEIRDEVIELRDELTHWRTVAETARLEYRRQNGGGEPVWWLPYIPQAGR